MFLLVSWTAAIQRGDSAKLPLPPKHLRPFCGAGDFDNDGVNDLKTQLKWTRAMLSARLSRTL